MVRIEVLNPPEDTVTLVGLNEAVNPPLSDSVKDTVPEKPPVLVTLMVMLCRVPAVIVPRADGFAVMVKSPVA